MLGWKKEATFQQIAMHCSANITQNFGENNVIMLDGYTKNQ